MSRHTAHPHSDGACGRAATPADGIRGDACYTKQEKEFAAWLDAVCTRHKAKRNFMQRLDEMAKSSKK
jgi:hypothetical protein